MWILNYGARPDLFVWASSGEDFYQDVSINGESLAGDMFFNPEPTPKVEDGEYFLFLINGKTDIPPESVKNLFGISNERLAQIFSGGPLTTTSVSTGFRFALLPVYIKFRSTTLVDYSSFDRLFEKRCHRDILLAMLTSNQQLSELIASCRLD